MKKKLGHSRVSEKQDNNTSDARQKKLRHSRVGKVKSRITPHQMHAKKKKLERSRVSVHEKKIKAQQGVRKKFAAGYPSSKCG